MAHPRFDVHIPPTAEEQGLEAGELPVTLVIPVRDEQETVGRLIDSIDAQTKRPAEVVFVDGGSTDRTAELVQGKSHQDPRYRLVQADGPATPGRGRNLGVAAARHRWVAMTDAGITLEPTWLEALWQAHIDHPSAEVVYGNYEFDLRSFFEECAAVAYCDTKRSTPAGPARGPSVVSCLVHRRAFDEVGGFPDLRAAEDDMFVRSVMAAGIDVTYAPDATVWWRLRPDLRSTFQRFRTYSHHNVLGGQQHFWHRGLARSYVPVAIGLVLTTVNSRRWLVLPLATIGARTAVRVARHRREMPVLRRPGPVRVALIAAVLVVSDVATALGWWEARRSRVEVMGRTATGDARGGPPTA